MPGFAVTNPPKDGASNGTATGAGHINYPPGVHGYATDTMGRTHPVGLHGFRLRQSTRPTGFPPEVWDKLHAAGKREFLADCDEEQALAATMLP